MNTSRRHLLCCLSSLGLSLAFTGPALASTSVGLSLAQLTRRSARVSLVEAVQHESEWASVGGHRQIVTRTRVLQRGVWSPDVGLDEGGEDEFFVLTLGGQVGTIVQKVPGEAALMMGRATLVFLSGEQAGARRILGMAQGAYPVIERDERKILQSSSDLPHLTGSRPGANTDPRQRLAVDVLHRRPLADAWRLIAEAQ